MRHSFPCLIRSSKAIGLALALLGMPGLPLTAAPQTHAWSAASIDPTTGMLINAEPVAFDPKVEDHRVEVDFDGIPLQEIVEWLRAVSAYAGVNFVVSPKLRDYGQDAPIFLKLRSVKLRDILSAIAIATDDRVSFEVRSPTMVAVVPGPGWQPTATDVTPPSPPPVAPSYQVVNLREVLRLKDPAAADETIQVIRELVEQTLKTLHGNPSLAPKLNYHPGSGILVIVGQPEPIKVTMDILRKRHRYWRLLSEYAQGWLPLQRLPPADQDQPLEAALRKCLQDLDAADRQLVDAKYFSRRSTAELARETGLTERAVESRLFRLRGLLRERVLLQLRKEPT